MLKLNSKKILLVDDNQSIHEDFRKILKIEKNEHQLDQIEEEIFGKEEKQETTEEYTIDSAYQGEQALELVKNAVNIGRPYALAFVDVRMPPGWDGIVTVERLWEVDPNLQVVICTAYADYSWKEIVHKLDSPNFLILKKPFDIIEIRQLSAALTKKWELMHQVKYQIDNLQTLVEERTSELEKTLALTRATLESTPEGILAISSDHQVITYNQTFLNLWNLTENMLQNEKTFLIFQRLAKQVEESNPFLKVMTKLANEPQSMEGTKEWKLRNNKTIEHYAQPQYIKNKVIGTVFCFRDISERKRLEQQLLFQSTHDSLTNLPNRIFLIDHIKQAIAYAKREKKQVAVLLFDLDNFKEINDSLGHGAGDVVLKIISERLSNNITDIDTVVRLGGDEFVVLLVLQSDEEEALAKTKQLLSLFLTPCNIDEHTLTVTTSIGISFYPQNGEDPDTLLKNADAALYNAKESGKNMYQVYKPEFNQYLLQRAELLTALRQALDRNEFVLHYQPLIQSETGKIIGLEALVRWLHPTLGFIYPQIFIPLAEEAGLIVSIGEWVLKTACLQTKIWHKINPMLNIAVNVSSYQFMQKNYVENVKNILRETNLDAGFLELELTESHIFRNFEETATKMHKLKALGIHLSIDDFGTGYASFSYLKYFPFDKVKIDKMFIQGIHLNNTDDAIVEAIINLANKMDMEVVAEGVEKPEQIAFLLSHHGNQMQGYYYSMPLDVEKCTELLTKESSSLYP